MRSTPTDDAGFALLELTVCVGLVLAGAVVALALLPALTRAARSGIVRAAATDAAHNAIERARAASAYLPPAAAADPAARAALAAGHGWALGPADAYSGAVRVRGPLCGASGGDVPLSVSAAYDATADRLTVTVSYPRDPCDPASPSESVRASEALFPAAFAPGTAVAAPIADPRRQ